MLEASNRSATDADGSVVDSGTALPKQFGKYSILGHLATGGMAEVYLARQAGLQGFEKIVVIKRVRPEMNNQATVTMFVDEARLVATLEHPNIVQVHEIGIVQDSYFFVMEYVHGADLRHLLERGIKKRSPVSLAEAIYIIVHVCSALHFAHEKTDHEGNSLGIIHRDVSPSNVLLSHDGAVKVCDFGIAKAAGRSTETVRGTLKGKFAYMSPEQCRGGTLDRRSDIFSIGILLYETTTSTRLNRGGSDFEVMQAIVDGPVPKPSDKDPLYPPALELIVQKALAKKPADRYQTAQEMQLDLEEFAREYRLPLSSVNIQKKMGALFEKRLDAWAKAKQVGKALEDHLVDTSNRRQSDSLPVFFPLGSNQDGDIDTGPLMRDGNTPTPHRLISMQIPAVRPTPTPAPTPNETPQSVPAQADPTVAKRRPSVAWLVVVVLAGTAGATVSMLQRSLVSTEKPSNKAFEADAEKIAAAIEAASRSAHMKADGYASTPMLRAAIETDAATIKDLAQHEYVFAVGKNETIEIFQLHNGTSTSLLRLPTTGQKLVALKPQETHLDGNGKELVVTASAPVSGQKANVAGVLELATPVDLGPTIRGLAEHATRVTLEGAGKEIVLLDGATTGTLVRIPVPAGDTGASLTLLASHPAPVPGEISWVSPVRYGAFALAGFCLLVYVAANLRRARS
ncbi:MAG: serine/threonine-protein kinase [Proteobacteria bacterium]|nr:serine/threonine-protein kinase [Pseudomonadota bacterium]